MLQTCTWEVPRLNLSYTGSLLGVLFSHSRPMSSRTYNKIAPTSFHIPQRNFSYLEEPSSDENENKTKRHLVADGDYSSTANCQTNIPEVFRGTSGIFRGTSEFLVIYSMNSRGTLGGKHRTNVTQNVPDRS